MLMKISAALDDQGRIASWAMTLEQYPLHPSGRSRCAPGCAPQGEAFQPKPAKLNISPSGNGDRNANPLM